MELQDIITIVIMVLTVVFLLGVMLIVAFLDNIDPEEPMDTTPLGCALCEEEEE